MPKPLVVGVIKDRHVVRTIRGLAIDFLGISSVPKLTSTELPRPPRLFVVQGQTDQVESLRQTLAALRQNWPLTDVLIWLPQGSGTAVRSLFKAGAKDVVANSTGRMLVECITETLAGQQLLPRLNELGRQRSRGSRFESMLSRNTAMWDLFDLCSHIATTEATVLIVGETGTGKDLLARAIHRRSGRKGRFVAANCASIPADLVNSELFGYVKGAFTGADQAKKGLVMHAENGTLFLDEIGDMPPEAQQSLLRMLQEKKIRPVGSRAELKVNVRIVAATNVWLDQAVRDGRFREDLFYRLDVIRMNVPPLRERPEDIVFLFGHFTKNLAKHYGVDPPVFSDSFFDALLEYDWPGNVRQLENFSERLVLARTPRALKARDFDRLRSSRESRVTPSTVPTGQAGEQEKIDLTKTLAENLGPLGERLERVYLQNVLKKNSGRIAESAQQAGISRRTLLRKLNQYGIEKKSYKD